MATQDELESQIDSFLASRETRREDWDTLAFQTKAGDEFRRAQIRYMGSGGTGHHESDSRIIQAQHFTFSNMFLPPGAEGPEHNHHDVEEAFFVLEGQLEVRIHDLDDGTRSAVRTLGYRELKRIFEEDGSSVKIKLRRDGESRVIELKLARSI